MFSITLVYNLESLGLSVPRVLVGLHGLAEHVGKLHSLPGFQATQGPTAPDSPH